MGEVDGERLTAVAGDADVREDEIAHHLAHQAVLRKALEDERERVPGLQIAEGERHGRGKGRTSHDRAAIHVDVLDDAGELAAHLQAERCLPVLAGGGSREVVGGAPEAQAHQRAARERPAHHLEGVARDLDRRIRHAGQRGGERLAAGGQVIDRGRGRGRSRLGDARPSVPIHDLWRAAARHGGKRQRKCESEICQ